MAEALTDLLDETLEKQIPTNLRLLLVWELVARAGVPVTPTAINAELGLPKPTIHRLFATLETQGFLQREIDGNTYVVGQRARRIASNTLSSLRIRTARLAILTRLAETIGETCNIAVPDRDAMIYLDRVETKWPLRIQLQVGTNVPFYCTASGKMYLSTLTNSHLERYLNATRFEAHTAKTIIQPDALRKELDRTRTRGYAEDDEEFLDGMIARALPICDDRGRLVSTLSFHAPTQRLTLKQSLDYLENMKQAAEELAKLLVE